MRHIHILLAIIIPVLFVACQINVLEGEPEEEKGFDHPVTEDIEGGKITYQYNDEVIVLSETTQQYLVKVEADTILYFSESTPEKLLPYKGGIISSAVVDDKTPYGLGNRVISVSQDDGLYKCVTTAAPLDEIFKELNLVADIMLVTDTISSQVEDVDGKFHDVTVSKLSETKAEHSFGSPNVLTVGFDGLSGKHAGGYVSGGASIGAVVSIDFELSDDRYDCSLSLYAGFDGEIGVKTLCEGYRKLLPRTGKWTIVNTVLTLGPVVLRPFVDVELGIEGSAEGSISTSVSKRFGAKFGMRNGKGFYENMTESDTNIVENISVDVKGGVALVTTLDFGMGLYTKNIAASIDPSLSMGLSTDFKVNNDNLFRNHPTLNFDITGNASVSVYAQLFGKDLFREEMDFASLNIFNYSWPLLPSLVENSLKVTKRDASGPLTFDAEYSLMGGLLSKLNFPLCPVFKVYKGSELIDVVSCSESISENAAKKFTFELTDLEHDISYTGKPCLVIDDNQYDEDGIPFSSTSPTAAVTDIVQTGAAEGSFPHNGYDYKYEFYYYVNAYIIGSDNCTEWGLYDPRSIKIHTPFELKDGNTRMYWTGWSNYSSATWSKTPYVILKENGDYKYFETTIHTTYYGGYFSAHSNEAMVPHPMAFSPVSLSGCRLDSVVFIPSGACK